MHMRNAAVSLKSRLNKGEMTRVHNVCHQYHLQKLSTEMVEWEVFTTALGLNEADTAEIKSNHPIDYKLQKYQVLCEWKNRNGKKATYKALADVFTNNDGKILAEKLLKAIINEPVPLFSVVSEKFKNHLKLLYKAGFKKYIQWPPQPNSATYINLALIKQQDVKFNKTDDTYIRSTIHHCPDDILKEKVPISLKDVFKFKEDEKKCILIEGGPGLGKTTLSIKICKGWAAGDLLEDYDAVILLPLRLPKLQKVENVADLLVDIDYEDKHEVMKEICSNNGDGVCFIVEGFDELPLNLQEDSIFVHISLLLPHALIIYTSRPIGVSHLIEQKISKRIEIIGFRAEQVQEYVETTLVQHNKEEDSGKSKALKLMKIIELNIFVKRLTHIPIYLAIITHIFNNKGYLPVTRTELFYWLVLHVVLHYMIEKKTNGVKYLKSLDNLPEPEKKHFLNICRLAFHGLKNSEITFDTLHLEDYCIPESINGLGLLHIAQTLADCGIIHSFNFMHLNIQEFCAAFHISKLSEDQQQEIFVTHQYDPKFQVCWQFYSGLTKLKCTQIFVSMIPRSNMHSSFCKLNLMQLLSCLYEAKLSDLCVEVIKFIDGNIDLSGCDMDLLSCSSLSYLIRNCIPASIKTLKLAWCGIGDEGLQYICESLISYYDFNSDASSHHSLTLDISYNGLTEIGAQYIAKLLSSPCVIKNLNCTGNYKIDDKGIEIIADSLLNNHVNILELGRTGLTMRGMKAISKVLCNDSDLKTLDISRNTLNCDMLSCLLQSLAYNHTLTKLILKWCELGADEAIQLCKIIKQNNTLVTLDLGYNGLGAGRIASMVRALKENRKLQTLNLNVNGITCDDASYIADLVSTNLNHLSRLHIGGNFEDQGLATVCEAIKYNCYLTNLDLSPYSMSVAAKPLHCLLNVFTNTNIRSLQLVPPWDCSFLSDAIASNTTIEELKICAQVTDGFEILILSIARNKSIIRLEFLFTKWRRQWLKDISRMLQVKTNLVSLVINGEVDVEDCMLLYDGLRNCLSLQELHFTPYGKITLPKALEFLECIQYLNLLKSATLSLNIYQVQHSEIPNQKAGGIPEQNITVFCKMQHLISDINERRHSLGYPELWLYIKEN